MFFKLRAARALESAGGSGGAGFRSVCKPGDVVVGFDVKYGNALDAITPLCVPLNPQRTEWAGRRYQATRYFGGSGGSRYRLECQPGDALRQLQVWTGPWGKRRW
jgi:hypothetical protein